MNIRPGRYKYRWIVLLLATQFTGSFCLAEEEIKSVYHKPMTVESFQRISEFFDGAENPGRRLIVRSQPEARAGEYFVITLRENAAFHPEFAKIKIELFTNGSADKTEFVLPLPKKLPKTKEIFAGITGADWPNSETEILAWRLVIQDAKGNDIAEKESFLWKSP